MSLHPARRILVLLALIVLKINTKFKYKTKIKTKNKKKTLSHSHRHHHHLNLFHRQHRHLRLSHQLTYPEFSRRGSLAIMSDSSSQGQTARKGDSTSPTHVKPRTPSTSLQGMRTPRTTLSFFAPLYVRPPAWSTDP